MWPKKNYLAGSLSQDLEPSVFNPAPSHMVKRNGGVFQNVFVTFGHRGVLIPGHQELPQLGGVPCGECSERRQPGWVVGRPSGKTQGEETVEAHGALVLVILLCLYLNLGIWMMWGPGDSIQYS